MARCVFLGSISPDHGQCQWAVKIGEVWTECDNAGEGELTSVNGGTAGGWFGWGARQDGPLVPGQCARSGATLAPGVASLGHTDTSDDEIRTFNKEFIKYNPSYRKGLSEKYCYNLLGWLLGPGYLLENFLQIDESYTVVDSSEAELSSIKEEESESEDPTFEPFPQADQEDSVFTDSLDNFADFGKDEEANHQSEKLDDNGNTEILKRKYSHSSSNEEDFEKRPKIAEDESSSFLDLDRIKYPRTCYDDIDANYGLMEPSVV